MSDVENRTPLLPVNAGRPIILAFSGGGQRSAAFATGAILWVLANVFSVGDKLYFTSVSGGGYAAASFVASHIRDDETPGKQKELAVNEVYVFALNLVIWVVSWFFADYVASYFPHPSHINAWIRHFISPWTIAFIVSFFTAASWFRDFIQIVRWGCELCGFRRMVCLIAALERDNESEPYTAIRESITSDSKSLVTSQWNNRMQTRFGEFVNVDRPISAFFDAVMFLLFMFVIPVFMFLLTTLPCAVVVSELAMSLQSSDSDALWSVIWYQWSSDSNSPRHIGPGCRSNGGLAYPFVWTRGSAASMDLAWVDPVVFFIPICICGVFFLLDVVSLLSTRCGLRNANVPPTYFDVARFFGVLVLFIAGFFAFQCSVFSYHCTGDHVVIEAVLLCVAVMIGILYVPRRGAIIVLSVCVSVFTFFVLGSFGPPDSSKSSNKWVLQMLTIPKDPVNGNGRNFADIQPIVHDFIFHVLTYWPDYVRLTGLFFVVYPKICLFKQTVMHYYYRFAISRAYFPPRRLSWETRKDGIDKMPECVKYLFRLLVLLDKFILDFLGLPFSFATLEFFPHDATTFKDVRNNGRFAYDAQVSVQFYDKDSVGEEHGSFMTKDEGVTCFSTVISSLNPNVQVSPFGRVPLVAAVAASAAAVSPNAGREHASFVPSSLMSALGFSWNFVFRTDHPNVIEMMCPLLFSLLFFVCGVFIFFGASICEATIIENSRYPYKSGNSSCGSFGTHGSLHWPMIIIISVVLFVSIFLVTTAFGPAVVASLNLGTNPIVANIIGMLSIVNTLRKANSILPNEACRCCGTRETFNQKYFTASDGGFVENLGFVHAIDTLKIVARDLRNYQKRAVLYSFDAGAYSKMEREGILYALSKTEPNAWRLGPVDGRNLELVTPLRRLQALQDMFAKSGSALKRDQETWGTEYDSFLYDLVARGPSNDENNSQPPAAMPLTMDECRVLHLHLQLDPATFSVFYVRPPRRFQQKPDEVYDFFPMYGWGGIGRMCALFALVTFGAFVLGAIFMLCAVTTVVMTGVEEITPKELFVAGFWTFLLALLGVIANLVSSESNGGHVYILLLFLLLEVAACGLHSTTTFFQVMWLDVLLWWVILSILLVLVAITLDSVLRCIKALRLLSSTSGDDDKNVSGVFSFLLGTYPNHYTFPMQLLSGSEVFVAYMTPAKDKMPSHALYFEDLPIV